MASKSVRLHDAARAAECGCDDCLLRRAFLNVPDAGTVARFKRHREAWSTLGERAKRGRR